MPEPGRRGKNANREREASPRLSVEALEDEVARAFERAGASEVNARSVARALVTAEADGLKIDVDPLTGAELAALVAQVSQTPAETVARVRAALERK